MVCLFASGAVTAELIIWFVPSELDPFVPFVGPATCPVSQVHRLKLPKSKSILEGQPVFTLDVLLLSK